MSVLNFLRSLTNKLQIQHDLPNDVTDFLPKITDHPDDKFIPPIQALATGLFPSYILYDLHTWNIRSNLNTITTGLIKQVMAEFRSHIWLPRCILNAEKEKRLGITLQDKRYKTPNSNVSRNNNTGHNVPGLYQTLLERWKRNWELGQAEMMRFVRYGSIGFDNGWGIVKHNIVNCSDKL